MQANKISSTSASAGQDLTVSDVRLRAAAQPFSHTFKSGEISVVLGGNAAGKTDLCRFIAGLPSAVLQGSVALDGQSLDQLAPGRRPVGFVYQAFVNYPNFTVFENIASPLVASGVAKNLMRDQVLELAARLRIDNLLERYPHELSGGQQQRLAIARALARQGDVLLLDEPLVNLDFKLREALEVELRDILRASQTIVIYTSSDQRDAYTLADEVVLLSEGEKLQSGPPMELYRRPVNLAAMRIMADPQVNTWQGEAVIHAVRPEHLQLLAADQHREHEFEMTVQGVETDGSQTLVFGEFDGDIWVTKMPGIVSVDLGQVIRIGTDAGNVVTFSG